MRKFLIKAWMVIFNEIKKVDTKPFSTNPVQIRN